ncbi:ribonuclease H-like domain-containing protein [Tanacetum coccineum]|uniref:Ribonuclease H-like domain-containing protein n=1 Tax=Tanacetum coccineum TaxID=301880 RepID=A0ABQ5GAU3_9ASTR
MSSGVIGDLSLESMEDEEVATMDGVFEGAFRALGDKTWFGGGSFGGCHEVATDENGVETELPPKTAQALLARQRERRAKSILLLAIPDEYQLRFHAIKDAKTLWAAIKKGLDKAYDSQYSTTVNDEDLDLIDHDNLEEMDLKWQVAMLSIRVKRFYKKTGRKLIFNGKEPIGFDKTKVECINCHRRGHFAKECRAPRNQGNRNGDAKYMTQDEPTEFALMAYTTNSSGSDTEVQSCSKNCVKTYEKLQKQFDEHRQTLSKANLEILAYQLGLESVEAQLIVHHKNEVVYEEKIAVLEFEVNDKSNAITRLKNQLDETLREKDDLKAKLEQFETSSKNLNKPINSLSGVIIKIGLVKMRTFYQYNDLQATDKPSLKRIKFTNARNESVKPKQAEKPRIITQNPKVDRRDWNGKMTQKLGLGFGFTKKAYFVCGSYSHLIKYRDFHEKIMAKKSVLNNMGKNTGQREIRPVWNSAQRINHQNKFLPSAVLTRFGRVPVSAAKQSSLRETTSTSTFRPVNTTTHTNRVIVSKLRTNAFHKSHSPIRRPFYKSTSPNTRISNEKVNTVRVNGVNTAGQIAVSAIRELCVNFRHHDREQRPSLLTIKTLKGGFVALVEVLDMVKIHTDNNVADLLTKAFDLKDLPEPFNDTYETPKHSKKVFSNMARQSTKFSGKVTPLFDSMLVQNQAPESEEPLQIETPSPVFHEPQSEAHIEQIFQSPTTYQRKRKSQKRRRTNKDTKLPQTSVPQDLGADEAIHKRVPCGKAITTAASLDAAQDSGSPRRQDTIGGPLAQTSSERVLEKPNEPPLSKGHTSRSGESSMEYHFELTNNVPPTPHDSPLSGGNTLGSEEGRMELIKELMETCTSLTKRVLALVEAKTAQDRVINRLKLRVKRLENKRKAITPQPIKRRLFKGRFETSTNTSLDNDFDVLDTEQITTNGPSHVSTADQVSTARPEVSAATPSTPPTTATVFDDEDVTMAMAQTCQR